MRATRQPSRAADNALAQPGRPPPTTTTSKRPASIGFSGGTSVVLSRLKRGSLLARNFRSLPPSAAMVTSRRSLVLYVVNERVKFSGSSVFDLSRVHDDFGDALQLLVAVFGFFGRRAAETVTRRRALSSAVTLRPTSFSAVLLFFMLYISRS